MKKRSNFLNSLLWTSGTIGGGVIYLLTAQLSFALTESFSVSAVYVGTVFLVSRIFDGITDFIAGNIIDRTNTRWGKARIYDLFMIVAWVFVILCFSVPEKLSETGKIVFVFVMYNMHWEEHVFALPHPDRGAVWHLAANTADDTLNGWYPAGEEPLLEDQRGFVMAPRSIVVLMTKTAPKPAPKKRKKKEKAAEKETEK